MTKKVGFSIVLLLIGASFISGCSTWNKLDDTEKGAVIGGGSGVVVGNAVAPGLGGTVVGGGLGAVAGGVVGDSVKRDREHRY